MSEHLELNMPLGAGAGQAKTEVEVHCGSCNSIIGTYSSDYEAMKHLHDTCPRCGKSVTGWILLIGNAEKDRK